jgi:uncharacterized integral membrane protein
MSKQERGAPVALIVSGISLVVVLIFIFQNTASAKVKFLWFNVEWGIWFVILVSMILGALIGWGFRFWRRHND